MKRTRHQFPPAVPVQQVIDRTITGRVSDRFLVGCLEIVNVQHLAGPGRFGKTSRPFLGPSSCSRACAHHLAWVSGPRCHRGRRPCAHGSPCPHPSRNRRLSHPTLTQQHHLDALALRCWHLPAKRSSQLPHLGFAAFGHLFLPNQMAQANHRSGAANNKQFRALSLKNTDSSRYGSGMSSEEAILFTTHHSPLTTHYSPPSLTFARSASMQTRPLAVSTCQ